MGPIITIHKDKNKREIDYQPEVMKLTKSGMALWMYLMRFNDMQSIQIHYKDLQNNGNIGKDCYLDGFKNLEENYFIIQRKKAITNKEYDFYAITQPDKKPRKVEKHNYQVITTIKQEKESEALKESKQCIEKFGF